MHLAQLFAFLLLLIPSAALAQRAEDSLLWDAHRKLTWQDFKGMPERDPLVGARTFSSIKYRLFHNQDTFYTDVSCVFLKRVSWKVTSKASDYSLNHEQRHFDISEVYARKMRAEFAAYQFRRKTVAKDIAAIFNRVCDEKDSVNMLYDKETLLSLDKDKQEAWNRKIDQLLIYMEALEQYERARK